MQKSKGTISIYLIVLAIENVDSAIRVIRPTNCHIIENFFLTTIKSACTHHFGIEPIRQPQLRIQLFNHQQSKIVIKLVCLRTLSSAPRVRINRNRLPIFSR